MEDQADGLEKLAGPAWNPDLLLSFPYSNLPMFAVEDYFRRFRYCIDTSLAEASAMN